MTLPLEEPTTSVFGDENQGGQIRKEPAYIQPFRDIEFAKEQSRKGVLARKAKRPDRELIKAIHDKYPANEIVLMIEKALKIAEETKSSKAILEVVKLLMAYTIGQPVQRSVTFTTKFEDMLAEVMGTEAPRDEE